MANREANGSLYELTVHMASPIQVKHRRYELEEGSPFLVDWDKLDAEGAYLARSGGNTLTVYSADGDEGKAVELAIGYISQRMAELEGRLARAKSRLEDLRRYSEEGKC